MFTPGVSIAGEAVQQEDALDTLTPQPMANWTL